jgi:hypothetical protein
MFQAQPSTFDTAAQDQLAWDEFGYDAILTTMDGAPLQADELGASQLTQPPPVLTQPSQFAAGGATRPAAERQRRGGGSDPGGRQSDTGCCRLIAGGHGDTVSRPPRTTGRQGT